MQAAVSEWLTAARRRFRAVSPASAEFARNADYSLPAGYADRADRDVITLKTATGSSLS